MKKNINTLLTRISGLLPSEPIEKSKKKWNSLADENHKYYIVSKKGRDIADDQFRKTGRENYQNIILDDHLLKERLGSFGDKKALDIGCGAGRLTEFLAKDFSFVEGIDISEKMIEKAEKRLSHLSNVNFTATDGEHYPFEDNSFDLVFSYIVFQHMPSLGVIEENFKEIKRVLKPSGIAKIQIRGGQSVRKGAWFYGPSFSRESAEQIIKKIGLHTVRIGDDNIKRFWLWLKKDGSN